MNNGYRQDSLIPAHLMAALFVTVMSFFALAAIAQRPVTISVSPRVAFAPATLHITLRVPPHADNRVLTVGTDGGDYVRSSGWELEGEQARGQYLVTWRDVPEGDYIVTAYLISATAVRGRDRVRVTVR